MVVQIISGFRGSGKTTFLNQCIEQVKGKNAGSTHHYAKGLGKKSWGRKSGFVAIDQHASSDKPHRCCGEGHLEPLPIARKDALAFQEDCRSRNRHAHAYIKELVRCLNQIERCKRVKEERSLEYRPNAGKADDVHDEHQGLCCLGGRGRL